MKIEIGFFGALMLLFIALKLMHYIDWNWWIILLPMWLCIGAFVLMGLVMLLLMLLYVIVRAFKF